MGYMKKIISIILLFLLLSCSITDSDEMYKSQVYANFTISDTNFVNKNTFMQGEDFILSFSISNMSEKSLHYSHGYPTIHYTIYKGDTIIANSTDYMIYLQPFFTEELSKNEKISDFWKAPNTDGRLSSNKKLILEVGTYKARVHHQAFFVEYILPQLKDIEFEIVK